MKPGIEPIVFEIPNKRPAYVPPISLKLTKKPEPNAQPINPKPIVKKTTPMYGLAHETNERATTAAAGNKNPSVLKILRTFFRLNFPL